MVVLKKRRKKRKFENARTRGIKQKATDLLRREIP
jgi:hypothetical protein